MDFTYGLRMEIKLFFLFCLANAIIILYLSFISWYIFAYTPILNRRHRSTYSSVELYDEIESFGIISNATASNNEDIYSTVNPFVCQSGGKDVQLVIVIPTSASRESARMAIRQTWGRYTARADVSIFFLFGITSSKHFQKIIDKERYMYRDILQAKFIDTYSNLTLKSIAMLKWVKDYCVEAKYLLKSDDDVFINVPRLLKFISNNKSKERAIYGRINKNSKPIRYKQAKHYISHEEYKPRAFPAYANGPAYLIPGHLVEELYYSSLNHKIIRLEDVFLTGIVALHLRIQRIHVDDFRDTVKTIPCFVQTSICIHGVTESKQFDYWKEIFHGKKKCTTVRY
ncbi:hypothetical protein RI129_012176 [Pyrocoelia pectoralis]|uniref:Hexosyltransferase n=1 Tax=Pyrocoelia pectoralis TaxID=417401 RepID=A0AAN7V473_9COLE